MSQNFILGSSGPLNYGDVVPFNIRNLPSVQGGTSLSNVNIKSGSPTIRPNIPYNNPYTQPRLMIGTSGKPISDPTLGKGVNVNNWAGGGYQYQNPKASAMAAERAAQLSKMNKSNAMMVFPELMKLWYGKNDKYGTVGPGRALLENTMGPLIKGLLSTPEQRAQAQQEYINKYKPQWMGGASKSSGKSSGGNSNAGDFTNVGSKGNSGMGSGSTAQAQALALAQQLGGNPPITNQQEADAQKANMDAINDYVSKLQEINQPYIEALQKFADNYGDLYNQNQLYNRRMRDLSAITGSSLWYQSAKDYNPLEVEATKIDLQKKIQDAQAGDLNAINEIMGNLAMAQEMGLPPEAAFANKNLLTMMAARDREANRYQIALENNLMKKYGIDRNYARALTVQAMRGQNALDVASMYTGAYGNGSGVAPGLNQQGTASNAPASYDAMLQSAHNKNNR